MAKERARAVAQEYILNLSKGKKITKGELLKKHGYAPSVQTAPSVVFQSEAAQEIIVPYVQRLKSIRDKMVAAIDGKDMTKEKLYVLSDSLKNLNYDINLAEGRSTSNNANLNVFREMSDDELVNYEFERNDRKDGPESAGGARKARTRKKASS